MTSNPDRRAGVLARSMVVAAGAISCLAGAAFSQISDESPAPMLQWFEVKWQDAQRRMPDWFMAGYGSVWLPPPSRCYVPPTRSNQNGDSAGYDPFDRFNLGKPNATTAYGTEKGFDAMVEEFHRAGGQVFIDTVLNHDSTRNTSAGFMSDGGYPGFWMNPPVPLRDKTSADNWGDFHDGTTGGYYQSEDPNGSRYCLLNGDLVALIDIDPSSTNYWIRQPASAGNPQNIPGGSYFNNPDPDNARFYPDPALGTDSIANPGMWYAGPLNTGSFSPPCDVPARNEPASNYTRGRFNLSTPGAGVPVPENATSYLTRWVQWMLQVHRVDGFRLDAEKHMPSWFFDTYFDAAVYNGRLTPDGRWVTPFSFGESVESNDFTFDRYVRKPNGRSSGRYGAGDAWGNRDALDLNGAGGLRDIVNGFTDWNGGLNRHLDATDDGYQNGSIGVLHIWSHDNGSAGTGSSAPPTPTSRQQGWFMHAYMLLRPGQSVVYTNARGINRSSGFWPRAGVTPAMGVEPSSNAAQDVLTRLVQISNWVGRGWYYPRWTDNEVHIFERASPVGAGLSGNVLVGVNRSYSGTGITSYDERTFNTNFPQGTRLIELTGNAARSDVDPLSQIPDVITVGAGGSVIIRVPRNQNVNGVTHDRGFVVYAPAIPGGTLTLSGQTGTLPAEGTSVAPWRRRFNAIPIINATTLDIQLATVKGDPGAPNNDNADDNALFRINEGFQDWNGNGVADIPYTNGVAPGYEEFVTQHQPLAGTTNTSGLYLQTISTASLPEGMNYVSVMAFRHRNAGEAPLFREWRQAFYLDRFPPDAYLDDPSPLADGTFQYKFTAHALDQTVSALHLILNPATVSDPVTLASSSNLATQDDLLDWSRTLTGLHQGDNTVLLIVFEESGRATYHSYTVHIGLPPCNADYNQDGGADTSDVLDLANDVASGQQSFPPSSPDFNQDGSIDTSDVLDLANVVAGGPCP